MTRSASNDYRIGEGSGYNRAANAPEGAAGSSNRSTYSTIASDDLHWPAAALGFAVLVIGLAVWL